LLGLCSLASTQAPAQVRFRDISQQAGLTKPSLSSMKQRYVVEIMSGGVALFDCDNDGKLDIVVVNDSTIEHARLGGDTMVTLYHQDANLKFTDITKQAGLTRKGWGMGVAVADYDNDGLPDLYVTGYNGNALYHNLGNCKFEDVTEKAGVAGGGFSTGAAWADYDRDGNVDLFVSRYVHTDINHLPPPDSPGFIHKGIHVEGPWTMPGESDLLFHNRGDGTFEEVSKKAGVDDPARHYGLGVVWGDYDNDGWPDLYVANDSGPKYLYHNKHDGTFEEVALLSGVALSAEGDELGSMGVDFGDFDRDGLLDIIVTNYASQPKDLYWNQGAQGFTDLTWDSRISKTALPYVGWGTGFIDFDNDGLPDILMTNGHIYPEVDTIPYEVKYREPLLLFHNKGNRIFEDISASTGQNDGPLQSRRGVAFGDINNDGNVDMVVFNVGAPPSLFLNETRNQNHRVLFKLAGKKSNRAAIGARVTVTSATRSQIEEVRGGSSYLSSNDQRLHFGLGSDTIMGKVEIRWPNGNVEILRNVPADAIYTVVESEGIKSTIKLLPPG
jgi:enediyne biosynthesis protein E4